MNSGLNWIADLPFSGITQIWLNKVELYLLILALIFGIIAVTERKKHSLLYAIILLLFFHLLLTIQHIQRSRLQKIIFFTLQKGYAAAFINRQKAIIVSDLTLHDQSFKFFIQPALDQIKIKNNVFVKWNEDFSLKFFKKKHHQISFFNYNILLVDSSFNRKTIAKTPKFILIWLHQNPKISLKELRRHVIFTSLVIDASNNNFNIEHYKDEAKKIKIQANVLKKNKAYLIDLNYKP
jgi:competence protein ComEC